MRKGDFLPSESEWKIMEELWDSDTPLTTIEIKEKMRGGNKMTLKMVRVLTNRLLKKGLVDFEVDKRDVPERKSLSGNRKRRRKTMTGLDMVI